MIIKAKSRSGPIALAAHLGNAEKNERVSVVESRGTVATDLRGALIEMDALASGTRCERPLYHAAISPEPPHRLTPEQRTEAVDALEAKLGFEGHARIIVMHEKEGREHIHVVWSRIDTERMTAVTDSFNYRKHEEVARDLERRFGHERVQGAHHERDGVDRPDRSPSRPELRQEERTGIKGKAVKAEVSEIFRASDGPDAFNAALADRGYVLAFGDRRDFVIIDQAGGIHSLARRLDGVTAAGLREFMAGIGREGIPTVEQAKELIDARRQRAEAQDISEDLSLIERGFSHGDDYVSQSRAALREHKRRQEWLESGESVARPEHPEEHALRERERQDRETEEMARPPSGSSSYDFGDIEMTDAMRERLDRLLDSSAAPERTPGQDAPDRQPGAPGGGRTRSR